MATAMQGRYDKTIGPRKGCIQPSMQSLPLRVLGARAVAKDDEETHLRLMQGHIGRQWLTLKIYKERVSKKA